MMARLLCWLTGGLLLLLGCRTEPPRRFLALGHIYRWDDTNDRMDPRIDALDLSTYDGIWLLGDLTGRTAERATTLDYLDRKFRLGSADTHWSLGNHDLIGGDTTHFVRRTGRPTFYYAPAVAPGLNVLVLNTNLFLWPGSDAADHRCVQLARQAALVARAAAQQRAGDHLVVLHHHALLPQERADTLPSLNLVWNYYHPEFWTACDTARTVATHYLPAFDAAAARGARVVMVGGDIGQRTKQFAHRDERGLLWLGTGINNSMDPAFAPPYVTDTSADHLLELRYDPDGRTLDHRFVPLRDLVAVPAR